MTIELAQLTAPEVAGSHSSSNALSAEPLREWMWSREQDGAHWEPVELPHTAVVADPDGRDHWQGVCRYRCSVKVATPQPGETHALYFGAAMHTASVFVDGDAVALHRGGFLPFEVDLTDILKDGKDHEIEVCLDNRDDERVPPGKPLRELDYCWYGGLYREVELRRYPPLHITDAMAVDAPLGGGLRVSTRTADAAHAELEVAAHVRNRADIAQAFDLRVRMITAEGEPMTEGRIHAHIAAGGAEWLPLQIELARPRLWSVADPYRYTMVVEMLDASGVVLDARSMRVGIRTVAFSRSTGFRLNGQRLRLRGTNRHQDHPWAGYALPPAAQRRDALRIKAAGFDFVRLSHYPQSRDFLDACDELGIVVMNCLPGWQFIGGDAFRDACVSDARGMIRRDRNHPCVVLWELSLNETDMDGAFMESMNRVAREEDPEGRLITCGWMDHYDVYLRSRQHGQIHEWTNGDKALVIAEYGDWEYYANNEGFDQKRGLGLLDTDKNSRAELADGERRLLCQAANHAEALEDNLNSPAVLDGLWSMFDYPRGYDPKRAACGVMDFFRRPKFSFQFYRSQRPVEECGPGWGGPMVFIASHWTAESCPAVTVFSNAEAVELRLNGERVGYQPVAVCAQTGFHRPLSFPLERFIPGTLEALAWSNGQVVAHHKVTTPRAAAAIQLTVDDLGQRPGGGDADLLICHAAIGDADGVLCVDHQGQVDVQVEGDALLLGPARVAVEAGIASFLIRCPVGGSGFNISAKSKGLPPSTLQYPVPLPTATAEP